MTIERFVEENSCRSTGSIGSRHRRRPGGRPTTPPKPRNAQDVFAIGEVLSGNYRILRVLGSGGMGLVYEAYDQLLNRPVAVKASWPDADQVDLQREAQVMAAMRGHGLPAVHAMGVHRDTHYYVMERLYGATLADYLEQSQQKGGLAIEEVVEILIGLAEVLGHIHGVGLIHCDLKPSNIMLTAGNRVFLLDFGISRVENITSHSRVLGGSPRYIAPEVIKADVMVGQAPLVDIYALGIIAFEMLVGHPPFCNCPVLQLLSKHIHERPPRVSELRPDTPPRLSALVADMLAKEPLNRPFSAEAVLRTLRALAAAEKKSEPPRLPAWAAGTSGAAV